MNNFMLSTPMVPKYLCLPADIMGKHGLIISGKSMITYSYLARCILASLEMQRYEFVTQRKLRKLYQSCLRLIRIYSRISNHLPTTFQKNSKKNGNSIKP